MQEGLDPENSRYGMSWEGGKVNVLVLKRDDNSPTHVFMFSKTFSRGLEVITFSTINPI